MKSTVRRVLLSALCCFLVATTVVAQTRKLTGTITSSEDNEPVIGASVLVKGTTIGTTTNLDGVFTLDIPADAKTLTVSYIGMRTQEVNIAGRSLLKIEMHADSEMLDEVIVVAYGTSTKGAFTGAASVVKSDKLEARPLTNISNGLLAAAPGVQVSTSNGQPGSSPSIYVRGLGSYTASSTPYIVLDGMPYSGSMSNINPSDIESMTVLKDASSTALYGSNAANGVILITTKQGKKDKLRVNVRFNQGIVSKQMTDYETVNDREYMVLYWENLRNQYVSNGSDREAAGIKASENLIKGGVKYNPYNVPNEKVVDANGIFNPEAQFMWADDVDWKNAVMHTGKRTDAGLSISGGTAKADYYASLGYLNEEGYIRGSSFERFTMSSKVNLQVTNYLKIGTNLTANMSYSYGNQNETSGNNSNAFRFIRNVGPIFPIHMHDNETKEYLLDSKGNKLYDFGGGDPARDFVSGNNPAIEVPTRHDESRRNNIQAKTYAEVTFLKDFKFTTNVSVAANAYRSSSASQIYEGKTATGSTSKTMSFTTTWTLNQLLSYSKMLGNHHIDAMVGHETFSTEYHSLDGAMKDAVFTDRFELTNYLNTSDMPGSSATRRRAEAYLSRVSYNYDDRYFLSGSYRRDATSRFERAVRWAGFFSIGAGWRIDKEKFMNNHQWIDMLKLRTAYGEVGNQGVDNTYPLRDDYTRAFNGNEAGFYQTSDGNPNFTWETSRNFDVAVEFSLWRGKFSGSIEWFRRNVSEMIYSVPYSPSTGTSSIPQNAGSMYNQGWEFELNYQPIRQKNWKLNLGLNGMLLKNKITYLPIAAHTSSPFRVEQGYPRYELYLRQWRGIYPETGDCLYVPDPKLAYESNGVAKSGAKLVEYNGETYTTDINFAKYEHEGTPTPKISGGINVGVSYKDFALTMTFYYQLGGRMYDTSYSGLMTLGTGSLSYSTMHKDILNRWQKPGDVTNVPRIASSDATSLNAGSSTRWLVSSDVLELANVNLSYDIPKSVTSKLGIQGLKFSVAADNLFMLTARKGMYPRRNLFSGYSSNGNVYLPSKVLTLGLNLSF
ncbi:MAG: TonB-dependent receptor [Mediterranea sp.]|jgi:TonB-linked SusC/RagA family outer membrane protein|nr:TonB-dependent receptor [Mediterranea sp.]